MTNVLWKPPKSLAARLTPQARYNRNAVVLPMASIRNTRLTSSKLDDIQFLDETDRETAGVGDDRRSVHHRQHFVINGDERNVVPPDGSVTGLRPVEK